MQVTVPSERNFRIFNAIECLGRSRREAAELFDISATRVQQIVTQVRQYLSRFGSPELLHISPSQAELGCLRLNYEKLRFMYRQLMRLWDESVVQSLDVVAQTEIAKHGGKRVEPNIKLIQQAMKVSMEQTKLAGRMAKAYTELELNGTIQPPPPVKAIIEEDDDEEELVTWEGTATAASPSPEETEDDPPVGGCTVAELASGDKAPLVFDASRASAWPVEDSNVTLAAMIARKAKSAAKKHPAQPR